MTTLRQLMANRRNALRSTGPRSTDGKARSRRNAYRHGLTAQTVIASLEDVKEYEAFQARIFADYMPETAVEKELVARLASLLWRLRRVVRIETGLFDAARPQTLTATVRDPGLDVFYALLPSEQTKPSDPSDSVGIAYRSIHEKVSDLMPNLRRYEASLWRQAVALMVMIDRELR